MGYGGILDFGCAGSRRDLGYRSGMSGRFLDQVDSKFPLQFSVVYWIISSSFLYLTSWTIVGINMGGLVRVNQPALWAEQAQQQRRKRGTLLFQDWL